MKKPMFILAALFLIGLGLFLFTQENHEEPIEIKGGSFCENAEPSCHADGISKYKTMTPLSTAGAILAGASLVGGVVVLSKQSAKKRPQKK